METNGIINTIGGKYSVLGKKIPSNSASFESELEKQMSTTKAKNEAAENSNAFPLYGRLENTPGSLCNELEKIGLYVYEGWITKEQEGAMRSEIGKLLQNGPLTAKDVGKKLEEMKIDVGYVVKDCLRENPMADGVMDDADWLPIDNNIFGEILKKSKSSF